jgi:sugar phosphate isomerase/epimerase
MIEEIVALGFERIELSHGMSIAKLPGIRKAYQRKLFTCVGVHNYFPAPMEVLIDAPDAYEFTSHREFDRSKAMRLTLQTLETAAEFEAQYVVLHMGSVPMHSRLWTKPLTEMLSQSLQSPQFLDLKARFIEKREKIAPLCFQRSMETLEILQEKAKELGVKLAVESRSRYEDIPSEREMTYLQEYFAANDSIGYWHDFGHVQLKHHLGLLDHPTWLGEMQPYLIGGHLHDVQWPARDHRVPFAGVLDYRILLQYFKPEMPLVWELSSSQKTCDIQSSLHQWREQFPDFAL